MEHLLKQDPYLANQVLGLINNRIEQIKPGWHTIRLDGHMLHNTKPDWGYAVKWKRKRWGWHISNHHPFFVFSENLRRKTSTRSKAVLVADGLRGGARLRIFQRRVGFFFSFENF